MPNTTTIASHLSRSASTYAKRALEAYVEGEFDDFALFAGIAIEHAAKAKLARVNAAFLAPDQRFKDAVALHGASSDIAKLPPGVATIGARLALDRLGVLEPPIRSQCHAAREVVAIRNGEAHLGVHGGARRESLFLVFLQTLNELMRVASDMFWEPHEQLVRTALDEHAADVDRYVVTRMSEARVRFDRRVGGLTQRQVDALTANVATDRDLKIDHDETVPCECPVCGSAALLFGYTENTDWDVEVDDGVVMYAYPELTFFADWFECGGCGLELDDAEELAAAGIETAFRNTTVDVDAWLEAHMAGGEGGHGP